MKITKKEFGNAGERAVSKFLVELGLEVLCENYRTPYGEVDIIALDKDTIVFVEVKARTSNRYGLGREAVNANKQSRYRNCAMHYVQTNCYTDKPLRFDVVEVNGIQKDIVHIKNAF